MSNSGVLYTPLQINGGGSSNPGNLFPRELYICADGTLYVGDPTSSSGAQDAQAKNIKVYAATEASHVKNDFINTYDKSIQNYNLRNCNLYDAILKSNVDCQGKAINNVKLNLSNVSYGNTLPTKANVGDIFILI